MMAASAGEFPGDGFMTYELDGEGEGRPRGTLELLDD
jgi:hypothetical protein